MSIENAIAEAGSAAELGRRIGASIQNVVAWKVRGIPADRVIPISEAVGWKVTPHQLRPDIYPNDTDGLPKSITHAALHSLCGICHVLRFVARFLLSGGGTAFFWRGIHDMKRSAGQWQAHIESLRTREERRAALEQVPEDIRPAVKAHVESAWALKRHFLREKEKRQAWRKGVR